MLSRTSRLLLCGLALAGLGSSGARAAPAKGPAGVGGPGLMMTPTRVVFDARRRNAEVTLSNAGTETDTFRLSLVHMEMDEAGKITEQPLDQSPGQIHPQELIRFSPREVTLAPHESQLVRIQVRKPADLPPGEYRIHLLAQEVPPPRDTAAEPAPGQAKGISINIIPVYGMALPLIVRHGETSAQVALGGLAIDPEAKTVTVRLQRSGNQSVYGDLKAAFQPASGPPTVIAEAKGISVYTPNASRTVTLSFLPLKSAPALKGGRLQVVYSRPEDEGGAPLARGELALP